MLAPGIHLIHKPIGPTSFAQMQAYVKEAHGGAPTTDRPRICHGGTLDPFASGLLLILVEPATRLFGYLHAVPKVYRATVRWGTETDSGDLLGQAIYIGDSSTLSTAQLAAVLPQFIGWHDQIPPATSAKRVDGERAYRKAHRGEIFALPPSKVYLHDARWLAHHLPNESELELIVRGGYYVRSLARDVGRLLGCGAHLSALHRTAIGPWTDPGRDRSIALHGRDVLPWALSRILTDQEVGALRDGDSIPLGILLPPDWSPPVGFPDPNAPIRGFHLHRLRFLLHEEDNQLRRIVPLRGGL